MTERLQIDAGHPGGNISVVDVGEKVALEQEIRDTTQWWFYWNFEAESAVDRDVTFSFENGDVVGRWGPATSHDMRTWSWLGEDSLEGRDGFTYSFDAGERVRFAFSIPYQVADFERYVDATPDLSVEPLTTSENGRDVPVATLGDPAADADVLFTCRHHACESVANYVLEGALDRLLDDATGFLERHRIHAVPFVDVDGVERGDQGKLRAPHDHNMDYVTGNALSDDIGPIYRSTAALMRYVEDLDLSVALDLHCPKQWGPGSDWTKFMIESACADETVALSERLGAETESAAFSHDPDDDERRSELRWIQEATPTCAKYMQSRTSELSTVLEIPYAGTPGNVITQQSARELGGNLADALVSVVE